MIRHLVYAGKWKDTILLLSEMNDLGFSDLEVQGLVVNKLFETGRRDEWVTILRDKRPLTSHFTKDKLLNVNVTNDAATVDDEFFGEKEKDNGNSFKACSTMLIHSAGHLKQMTY